MSLVSSIDSKTMQKYCQQIIQEIIQGSVVLFLGTEHNLCDRPEEDDVPGIWKCDLSSDPPVYPQYPPTLRELSAYLSKRYLSDLYSPTSDESEISYHYGEIEEPEKNCKSRDLQLIPICPNWEPGFSSELHEILCSPNYHPNKLHRSLAAISQVIRLIKSDKLFYPLIVTTSYDRMLELAFEEAGETFDLVYYSKKDNRFYHETPEGMTYTIERPNMYMELSLEERPVILKVYGTVGQNIDNDRLVISEEDYIDFFSWSHRSDLIPAVLLNQLLHRNVLFLGYCGLKNWHQRIILNKIWPSREYSRRINWYSIQWNPPKIDAIERLFLERYKIEVHEDSLEDFVDEFYQRITSSSQVRASDRVEVV